MEPHIVIQLLLEGPRGWLVLAVSLVVTALLGRFWWRRFRTPRRTTAAFIGGLGRMDAQTARETERLLDMLDRFEAEIRRIHDDIERGRDRMPGVADRVLRLCDAMRRECQRLDDLNIAFARDADHRAFLDRIWKSRRKAEDLRAVISKAKRDFEASARALKPQNT